MDPSRSAAARTRAALASAAREFFRSRGFDEVETPCLVSAPGMEPHICAFESAFVPEGGGAPHPLWLHTSPEYAMKRLLAEGWRRVFQLARVFRNGEVSATHNPEFTMLEFYRAGTDYRGIMEDLEALLSHCARELRGGTRLSRGGREVDLEPPFPRLAVAEAFAARAGIDLASCRGSAARLREAARARGIDAGPEGEPFEDAFFRVFLQAVEPGLGFPRPVFLVDWPSSLAALARLKRGDPRWAERFELFVGGLELANGFSELDDAAEQRRRLEAEQARRRQLGLPVYPIDELFLEAVGRMPEAGGVAVGFDRLLMLLCGASSIEDVLLFPAHPFLGQ